MGILTASYELCVANPANISQNLQFLLNTSKLDSLKLLGCDDMGAWTHLGSPIKMFKVEETPDGNFVIKEVDKSIANIRFKRQYSVYAFLVLT